MWRIDSYTSPFDRRPCQDRLVIRNMRSGGYVAALFDGNGKKNDIVDFCAQALPRRLAELPLGNARPYMLRSFTEVAEEALRLKEGGSSAAIACLAEDGRAYLAVLGNSLIIANRVDHGIYVSPESNSERAFGRREMGRTVSVVPELDEMELCVGDWLCLTSEGLLNPAGKTYVADRRELISLLSQGTNAREVVLHFEKKYGKKDDASLIVCRFFPQAIVAHAQVPEPYLLAGATATRTFELAAA